MVVITGNYGQLCNRLIVYANFVAAAREHRLCIAAPGLAAYADYFDATRRDALSRYPVTTRPALRGAWSRELLNGLATRASRYARKLHNRFGRWPAGVRTLDIGWHEPCDLDSSEFLVAARSSRILLAKGWRFRAAASFSRHADAIRELLKPRQPFRSNIERRLAELRTRAATLVGVHIRHGDYRAFANGRYFFSVAAYASQMRHVQGLLAGREPLFVVCSNEPQPADAFGGLNVVQGAGHALEDLYLLAGCDYLIGPPSTYGQWASFHGRVPRCVLESESQRPLLADFATTSDFASTPLDAAPSAAVA
jgi:Glycosyl transferase family 11